MRTAHPTLENILNLLALVLTLFFRLMTVIKRGFQALYKNRLMSLILHQQVQFFIHYRVIHHRDNNQRQYRRYQ